MMQKRFFGTDGIRGKVGQSPITVDFILKLGWAVGKTLSNRKKNHFLIGKDTRLSGYMFESALEAGLVAAGANVVLLGPLPTPAIAYLTKKLHAAAGIVISASHNPYFDNGFKFFSDQGEKLNDDQELQIESYINEAFNHGHDDTPGKAERYENASDDYIRHCLELIANINLNTKKIVLDCANGATYKVAPIIFEKMGAKLIVINDKPNGLNINQHSGSTQTETLVNEVKSQQADIGIAFDGDGDRVIMVDHCGNIVDGDQLLYVLAVDAKQNNKLEGDTVVGTVMSNLGFEQALKRQGIDLFRTKVGDRHIHRQLIKKRWNLGGESSGHLIFLDYADTGDGIISAMKILEIMHRTQKSLAELTHDVVKLPHTMINVPINEKAIWSNSEAIANKIKMIKTELNNTGRVILRPSGTEPVIRVSVEGEDEGLVTNLAHDLADVVRAELSH